MSDLDRFEHDAALDRPVYMIYPANPIIEHLPQFVSQIPPEPEGWWSRNGLGGWFWCWVAGIGVLVLLAFSGCFK